jgi:hypothetical protein
VGADPGHPRDNHDNDLDHHNHDAGVDSVPRGFRVRS